MFSEWQCSWVSVLWVQFSYSRYGIIYQITCPYTPQQNGIVEHRNRHLLETTRAFIFQAHTPRRFWSDTVLTACYLINRMPSSVFNVNTQFSRLYPKREPFSLPLKIFGCLCYIRDTQLTLSKLDPKAIKCIFLGYQKIRKDIIVFHQIWSSILCLEMLPSLKPCPPLPQTTESVPKVYLKETFLLYPVQT